MTCKTLASILAAITACVALVFAYDARAEEPSSPWQVEGGLRLSPPAALSTGLSTGVGAGFVHGRTLAWGASASWSSATEHTISWAVTHADLRFRLLGVLQTTMGKGTVGLRLGAGGTVVHESRTRHQGSRAGLEGSELEDTSWRLLPAADLELVITLKIVGPWGLTVGGGPSLVWAEGVEDVDRPLRPTWTGTVGVAWVP